MIWLYDFPPPAEYDHPYTGPGSVIVLPLDEVQQVCEVLGVRSTRGVIYACSWGKPWRKGWSCTIILPDINKSDQDMLRRVEQANCNGWPRKGRE